MLARLLAPPFRLDKPGRPARSGRRGLTRILDWLAGQPGDTWQERWAASGAEDGRATGGSCPTGGSPGRTGPRRRAGRVAAWAPGWSC